MRWLRRSLVAVGTGVLYGVLASSVASALFSDPSTATMSVASKRIFPTSQATSAWAITDASGGGAPSVMTDPWAQVDGRVFTTSNLTGSFSSSRYVQLAMSAPLPTAVPVTSVELNLTMASPGPGTSCVYVEIRRATTNALLGTQGSSSNPLACSSSSTQTTTTSNLPYVTSSTDADDLRVKIFVRNSSNKAAAFDRITVTGTMYSSPFTLYETSVVDASSGSAITTPWALAASDATTFTPSSGWTAAFNSNRYLEFGFPEIIPSGASISAAELRLSYAPVTSGQESCIWIEVYADGQVVETFGSESSPLACRTSTSQNTDVLDLPAVTTVAEANSVIARVYARSASNGQTRHGLATLTVDYVLT